MRLFALSRGLLAFAAATSLLLAGCSSSEKVSKPTPSKPKMTEPAPADDMDAGGDPMHDDTGMGGTGDHGTGMGGTSTTSPTGTTTTSQGGMTTSGRAFPTGDRSTSVLYVEKTGPAEVIVGEPYEYRLVVTNLTPDRLTNVTVTDACADYFEITSSTPDASREGNCAVWRLGDMDGHEVRNIVISGRATQAGQVINCTEVSYEARLCLTTNVVAPALQISKSGPERVMACDPITYTFTVTNSGTGTARNVRIEDDLPAGLSSDAGQRLVLNVGNLAGGESKEVTAQVRAGQTGSFQNRAVAVADGNLRAESNVVTTAVCKPVLALDMTGPSQTFMGTKATFRINVKNTGDCACTDTVLTATVPAGTTFAGADNGGTSAGGEVQWMLGSVEPGASRDFSYTVTADEKGPITATARASCVCADEVTDQVSLEVKGIPAILLEVIDIEDPIQVGATETYEIQVTNQGSATDTNIKITCELENEMEFVSAAGATNGTVSGSTVTMETLPSLAAKAVATWRVTVRAKGPGDVRFKVVMNSDQLGRTVEETEATNFYE